VKAPESAVWRHVGSREGFEVVFFADSISGHVAGIEQGEPYAVRYEIRLDERGHTLTARVWGRSRRGPYTVELEADGEGHWTVDGQPRPELDGVYDVDLEASSLTNAFPVRRLALGFGESADAPAAYVRSLDGVVERLEQRYACIGERRYDYRAPAFDTHCELVYDEFGLVLDYPDIAVRVDGDARRAGPG
jgi:hypothetical protein